VLVENKLNKDSFFFFTSLILCVVFTGCSVDDVRTTIWIGGFFIDSNTIGAVNVRYDTHHTESGYDKSTSFKNITMNYNKYILSKDSSFLSSALENDLTGYFGTEYKICYQDSWIAYNCIKGSIELVIYNILNGTKVVLDKATAIEPICFSKTGKYLLANKNSAYVVYDVLGKTLIAQIPIDNNQAFYIDENQGVVYVYKYLTGIKKFNIALNSYEGVVIKSGDLGDVQSVINYGDAILVYKNNSNMYFNTSQIEMDSMPLLVLNTNMKLSDVDLVTGNIINAISDVYIGNIYGKFDNKKIFQYSQENLK
jgi:hypothetical protein